MRSDCSEIGMHIVTVHDLSALEAHWSAWDRLAWNAPQKLPTLLPAWVDAFLRHKLKREERWLCCFAYLGDRLVGVLPVIVSPHRLLGSTWPILHTPFDAHTNSGDVLLDPDHANGALKALLTEVRSQVPRHIGIDFKVVRRGSPIWAVIKNGTGGYIRRWGRRHKYSFLNVQGDYNDYYAGLGKMRRELRVGHKRLESRGAVSIEFQKEATASVDFLAEYLALEASGWKGRNGTAMLNDSNATAFYTTLIRNFADSGYWEWHIIRVNERVVAAQMGARCGDALALLKYSFDEDFAECTPGHLLVEEVIKETFSRSDVREINPMSVGPQHRLFRMNQDEYIDIHLVRQGMLPYIFHLPNIVARTAYQDHIRPHIPAFVKEAHRKYRRRGDRKPRRAGDAMKN
jgi:hypothetical protein